MLTIKVFGPGCANCRKLEEISTKALAEAGVEGEVIKVTDVQQIVAADVLKTPGLVDQRQARLLRAASRRPSRCCSGFARPPADIHGTGADAGTSRRRRATTGPSPAGALQRSIRLSRARIPSASRKSAPVRLRSSVGSSDCSICARRANTWGLASQA